MVIVSLERLKGLKVKTLVEVGCGSGSFLEQVRRESSIRGVGLELVRAVVDECRAKGLEVHKCDLGDYPV